MRKCTYKIENGPNVCQSATSSVWEQYPVIQDENLKKEHLSQVSLASLEVLLTVATLNTPESKSQMSLHLGQLQNYVGTSLQPSRNGMLVDISISEPRDSGWSTASDSRWDLFFGESSD